MGNRRSRSDARESILGAFDRLEDPGAPLTIEEVTAELDRPPRDVRGRLEELEAMGQLRSKTIDDRRIWWRSSGTQSTDFDRGEHVLEHAADAIFVTDREGRIEYVNPAFEEITGYGSDEAIGNTPRILKSDVHDPSYYENLWETILDGEVWEEEIVNEREDGTRYHAHQTIAPIADGDGTVRKFLAIQRDVTERRRLREELERSADALAQLYEIAVNSDRGVEETFSRVLEIGAERLGFPAGYATRIEDGTQEIVAAIADDDAIRAGRTDPLGETYCRKTIESDEPYVIEDALEEGWEDDSAYENFGLRCYVGASIFVDDELYGTLCFGSDEPLEAPVSETYQSTVKTFAQWMGQELERRRYERRLERQNDLFEKAQNIADVGAWEYDVDADELRSTEQIRRIYGLSPETAPDLEEAISYYHPQDRPWLEDAMDRAISAGKSFDLELRLCTADGDTRWVRIKGDPRRNDDGEVAQIRGTIQDVEERKQREEELEQSRTRFRTLFEQSPDAIILHDLEGNVLEVNRKHVENLGYSREEIESMHVTDFESGANDEFLDRVWTDMAIGERRAIDGTHRRRDGSEFPVEVWLNKIEIDGHERILALSRDVTEREERERQLRVLNRVLRHNLSNDMNVIKGFAETIAEQASGTVVEDAERIVEQSDRLLETVEKQRAVVEVLSDPPRRKHVDVGELVRTIEAEMEANHPEVRLSVDRTARATAVATADLPRAVEELVENAIVHNDRSEPSIEVEVEKRSDVVRLRVVDEGPPIPEMDRAVLTGDSDVDPLFHGRGMGLWLVYWIVRRSDGRIDVEHNDPRGNVVTIELPRER